MLDVIDLSKTLSKEDNQELLPKLRLRLLQLQQASWQAGVATVLMFEGWDGSGKGDCVRRVTERLEPRGYRVFYVTRKPRTYERYLPWMWRFWLEIPNYGQMTIFHRSWYRRVMLLRGEGRMKELEWHRAVRDILDFERALTDDGYVLMKFFLHLSKEEREARYQKMEQDPAESWRISKHSWKHHHRYEDYYALSEEVLVRTETAGGPWKIIEATDRRWARLSVFQTVVERLEEALTARGLPLPEVLSDESEDYLDTEEEDEAGDEPADDEADETPANDEAGETPASDHAGGAPAAESAGE